MNELLAFAAPLHTIVFAGLWCVADRRGVLEDRPQRIHTLVNPGRSLSSTKKSLWWLEQHCFIVRYEVDKHRLIKVLNFEKHQNPHRDEKPSQLPDYGAGTVLALNGHGADTVPAQKKPESAQKKPEPLGLIPDSGFLIPDSPSPRGLPPNPPLARGARRERRSEARAEADEAAERWERLVNSRGADRDHRVQSAIDRIGGWQRIQARTPRDEPTVKREFCDAYREAQ